ncbi:hypothetical protein [Bradyrhizobium elkanii]|uniref:Uncharacterized protein n=1 Tax=Bradyrhizobium elkanii TaxID=29448 RepID=A0ABV4F0W4_BRAEL|nr:hypothetical protein [Bradyrhizobium elkanii]MCP1758031.1 hypothetical protein [Bradyrhizobium elkanii]MCP1983348.1 hypothetical protein [Bradyrhizobium elkanii]MCS3881672.1 hypothetical protein [Bradyrhizobium elkanii]MCS4218430.1 hypothetical protein [Bradyrhizobium elkanii]MCW2194294.1 hypothetical protein [Bradyrhizobium elkanii]
MKRFRAWCALMSHHHLPATPFVVASFIGDNGGLKPDELFAEVAAIDEQHQALGYAPPGRSDVALKAFDAVHPVEPPRSWPKEEKRRFLELPHDLQVYFAEHEDRREKEIKRAFSEAAAARQKLEEMEANGARQANAS